MAGASFQASQRPRADGRVAKEPALATDPPDHVTVTPRFGFRRFGPTALVVVGVIMLVGAAAAWQLAPPVGSPPAGGVWWRLTGGPESVYADGEGGAPRLDQATVRSATEIPIVTYYPWPNGREAPDDSWLGMPTIVYTSTAVIITMHVSPAFTCGPPRGSIRAACGWSLEPRYVRVPVHLSEPLGDRALFDGSTNPPKLRSFPWGWASSIDLPAVKSMYVDACQRLTVLDAALCKQFDIDGMTAHDRYVTVPTNLDPADADGANPLCLQLARAHVDADPDVPGFESGLLLLNSAGHAVVSCSFTRPL